jgi:hypothetical protein
MHGAIPPLPEYAFMAWCSVKGQGQFYLFTLPKILQMLRERSQLRGQRVYVDIEKYPVIISAETNS